MNTTHAAKTLTGLLACLALVAAALASAAPAYAQTCAADGDRPVVCDVRVGVAAPGDRIQEVVSDEPIQIPAGGEVSLEVQGNDRFGRTFPAERMLAQLETDRTCSGLVAVEANDDGRFELTAGTRHGSCRLYLWVPGNLNLEWSLNVEVVSAVARGYSREQAEVLVAGLYQGILGRDPEPAGLQTQAAEVLRGRLENVVSGMYQSSEFLTRRSQRSPMEQLDDLYRALLGREVDAEGIRAHLNDMEQRRYVEVALRIVTSQEFEQQLLSAADHSR